MTFWQIVGFLISGGLLTTLGGVIGSILTNRSEERRAKRRREEEIVDRKFILKKEAYIEALKEFNQSGLSRFAGIGDRPLTPEEISNRNSAMTLFDVYAPENIKSKAAIVIRFFQQDLPADPHEREAFHGRIIEALNQLRDDIREDLGLT